MLLSIAMATGSVLMEEWNSHTYCGCALAAGLRGAGKAPSLVVMGDDEHFFRAASDEWKDSAYKEWPWLNDLKPFPVLPGNNEYNVIFGGRDRKAETIISCMFQAVAEGKMTFDQIVDWTRENEPPEPVATVDVHSDAEVCAV